jgi:hypothetical protein
MLTNATLWNTLQSSPLALLANFWVSLAKSSGLWGSGTLIGKHLTIDYG